ncbi:type III pantothenate kinase [Paremcibacter congregatus]|uniref:Type III pantothenate kinase n=1 Tax=Paremcibacter congregatus TaxID=2043170 RepID=A0A2G4YV53_9PROT|nr:type III pantothenate kinase [Paremcibacter congregatus]PHZ85326.1 pantothenate kinase [Paremcibacter congregatus]QDE27742.1 type III pantothenate kinase [Paremcibacter congregatus]|tara:strand:+ start:1480 stop:2262 length:783 start_codon:yes stop_codon:yes gene_type:complete
MLLAIDAGNTNIVFALHDGNELRHKWRISSSSSRTADEYMVWLTQLMKLENISPDGISGAIIATVVPQALFPLQLLCRRYFNCTALVVGEDNVDLGIKIKLDNPKEVGADRLVNGVAAHIKYGGPMIIIDFGTATTFDVIDEDGDYCGGIISPGVNLSVEALHMAAAKLPRVAVEKPEKVIGTGTVTAIQSGIFWGYVGLVEGVVRRIKAEFAETHKGAEMKVLATGGLAPLFFDEIPDMEAVDQELTTYGLSEIYTRNS